MHARLRSPLVALAAALLAASPAAVPRAGAEPPTLRVALLGAAAGPGAAAAEEALFGVRAALRESPQAAEMRAKGIALDLLDLDDGDSAEGAVEALQAARKAKCHVVFAAATGATVAPLVAAARAARQPLFLVGSAGPAPSVEPGDPILSMESWPVDQAIAAANFLAVHSDKEHLGVFGDCVEPGFVIEETPRGRELGDALVRNMGPRQHVAGTVRVPPRGKPSQDLLEALRALRCDRLVLVGEPDLVDGVADALAALRWDVPVFCVDGMLSRAATAAHDGRLRRGNFVAGLPQWAGSDPPDALVAAHRIAPGESALYPRTVKGYLAGEWVARGALAARLLRGPELLEAVRAVAYDGTEANMPVIDETGRAALYHWHLWRTTGKGPVRIKPTFLPQEGFGPLLRMQLAAKYQAEPGTKVVWLTFGDEKSRQPRTIEKDMAVMGLGTRGYEGNMDEWLLDELMARTLGKLNRLFLRNYDGTPIPGVSYAISFTAEKPEGLKNHEYWKGVIAGDDQVAGGRAWPGEGRVEIYSTYMHRTDAAFRSALLKPAMNREDRQYMDGTYSWGTTQEQNFRADRIRCLVDGYASFFALTGAHEFGHVAGLGHDEESGRSIMNVVEGAGIRETNAWFIPKHAAVLERVLGRHGEKRR